MAVEVNFWTCRVFRYEVTVLEAFNENTDRKTVLGADAGAILLWLRLEFRRKAYILDAVEKGF